MAKVRRGISRTHVRGNGAPARAVRERPPDAGTRARAAEFLHSRRAQCPCHITAEESGDKAAWPKFQSVRWPPLSDTQATRAPEARSAYREGPACPAR